MSQSMKNAHATLLILNIKINVYADSKIYRTELLRNKNRLLDVYVRHVKCIRHISYSPNIVLDILTSS